MITQITNEEEYEAALKEVSKLMDIEYDTSNELVRVAGLVEAYEAIHYPIDPPTEPMITYAHKDNPKGPRFQQQRKDGLPIWAVDIQPCKDPTYKY